MYGFFCGLGALNYPQIGAAITKFEGSPGSVNYRNNNPGNLVYASWESAYGCSPGGEGGFAKCPTMEAGQEILDKRVTDLASSGKSLSELLSIWAGPQYPGNSQASYDNYVSSVAADTGLDPSLPISQQLSPGSDSSVSLETPATGYSVSDLTAILPEGFDYSSGPNWGVIAAGAVGLALLAYVAL